ncbi:MAG: DUF1294 domain-containing protein [Chloroflexota bacterium]
MNALSDPRNRRSLIASVALGVILFVLLWLVLGWPPLLAWLIGWTPPAFAAYGIDKWQATHDGWRIPELVLHLLALIGGVIGAWAGRIVFRHKTNKPVFLVVLVIASIIWGVIIVWSVLGR